MNKIVNGKRYNTDSAQLVGVYETNEPEKSDFWCREELYLKRTGEFFLVGHGGAQTGYAIWSVNGNPKPGEELRPLDPSEAEMWVEEHLSGDEYEKLFGEVAEDGSRSTLSITMDSATLAYLREQAQEKNTSLSAYVERLIQKGVDVERGNNHA